MQNVHYDNQLASKLRQIVKELASWSDKAQKGKLSRKDIDRMEFESKELSKLISNKEL